MPARPILSAAALALSLAACASTGATFRSGVGDSYLERPPYYAGAPAAHEARIGYLPVAYQRGATQASIFDPRDGDDTPTGALLAEMTAYLDSLERARGVKLAEGGRVSAVTHAATAVPPDVQFGCQSSPVDEDCTAASANGAGDRSDERARLAVGRPSAEWTAWMNELQAGAGVDRALVVTLEVGQLRVRQKNWRGGKVVDLGTGYSAAVPWLTSLDDAVSVLQLTGVVVGRDGRALRIGAEGMLARPTPLAASAVGARRLITDADVERLRSLRREDLPGRPLAWQVAMRNLVAGLTGEETVAER
jgi:hypothetical protein